MQKDLLLYCVKYLHRHPSEVQLTIEQLGDVAFIGDELFEIEANMAGAKIG